MLSIVIATKNRPEFLKRLLGYFADTQSPYPIYIGDSSEGAFLEESKKNIQDFQDRLVLVYKECPQMDVPACHRYLAQRVRTPYVVAVADGAFLVTSSLKKCIDFLESHPNYVAAHGKAVTFTLAENGTYGSFTSFGTYPMPVLEQGSATERLTAHLQQYRVAMYCVMRTFVWQAIWAATESIKNPSIAGEILPSSLCGLFGKIRELDCLYLVRHMHPKRTPLPTIYDLLTDPEWSSAFEVMRNCCARELVHQDGVSLEEAYGIFKRAFYPYLCVSLQREYREQNFSPVSKLKAKLRHIEFLEKRVRPRWQRVRSYLNPQRFPLPSLLKKKSPYHNDFMPIYKKVTSVYATKSK